ncbi:unnamed protein product [Tilletia controversa]|nr:unnamed protein product [Tilletia controversa]CAD6927489.1 unnamed protein product [Tilletia controversa]CAD6963564.1 unnamed protein product [Tilletia controversa]CAD6968934.1 unnamed protein product [Tilletia controversa]
MPHASIIVPSVLGAAAAAAAFEVSVFRPWRERNAPQGLHVLLSDEFQKLGRTAEAFGRQIGQQAEEVGRHVGQQADELGGNIRTQLRKVGEDVQHAASEVRESFLELTQAGGSDSGGSGSGWGSQDGDHRNRHGRWGDDGQERRGLMRDESWPESSRTSALDRPMYAPAETDYDPDDEQTLASLQRNRRRTAAGAARDDADNITLRDSSYRHQPQYDEDEGTAAFRAHRSLIGPFSDTEAQSADPNPHSTIFDFDDFQATRDAFGIEEIGSPHHALGSPSVAASEGRAAEDDDFFSSRDRTDEQDAPHLDASTLSLASSGSLAPAPGSSAEPNSKSGPASESSSTSDWHRPSTGAPSVNGSTFSDDGELISAAASEAGQAFSTFSGSEGGWVDLAPSSPDNFSPPSSPSRASQPRLVQ